MWLGYFPLNPEAGLLLKYYSYYAPILYAPSVVSAIPETKEKIANGTRDSEIEDLQQEIEKQKRIKDLEKGKESGIDATEALAIETAQKAYDDTLESYNEGVDQAAELAKAKEELEELELEPDDELLLLLPVLW